MESLVAKPIGLANRADADRRGRWLVQTQKTKIHIPTSQIFSDEARGGIVAKAAIG
jgi:hypothetical protein